MLCLRVESYKVSFINLFSLCLKGMNTRRSNTRREKGGVANERVPPRVDQVLIVGLEEENEEVPVQEPQEPPEPQEPQVTQVPPMPQDLFAKRDMTNAELRDALMNLTQLMASQAHVVNNHFVAQSNQGVGPQPNASTPASRIWDFIRMNPPTFHSTKMDEDT